MLLVGLRITLEVGVQKVHALVGSRLVANQINGAFKDKEARIMKYLEKVRGLIKRFQNFDIIQIPRSKNKEAHALSKLVVEVFDYLSKQVLEEILPRKSIE